MKINPSLGTTQDIKSIGIVAIYVLVPLFLVSVISHYTVGFIASLGIVELIAPATGNWGAEYFTYAQGLISQLDKVMLLIFATLIGRLTLQSFRTDMHPIYGIAGLFSIPVLLFIAAFGSNIIGMFTSIEFLQTSVNAFPLTYTFFENTPTIVGWIAVFIIFVMIGSGIIVRRRQAGGGL